MSWFLGNRINPTTSAVESPTRSHPYSRATFVGTRFSGTYETKELGVLISVSSLWGLYIEDKKGLNCRIQCRNWDRIEGRTPHSPEHRTLPLTSGQNWVTGQVELFFFFNFLYWNKFRLYRKVAEVLFSFWKLRLCHFYTWINTTFLVLKSKNRERVTFFLGVR